MRSNRAGCLSDLAGQVTGLDRSDPPGRDDRRASRVDRLCAMAAREAVEQAGLAGVLADVAGRLRGSEKVDPLPEIR